MSVFVKDIGLQFHFLVLSVSGSGFKVVLTLQNELGNIPSSCLSAVIIIDSDAVLGNN